VTTSQTGKNEPRVSFLDVGQGDSILIQSPSGNTLLVDAGPSNSVLRVLGSQLPFSQRDIDVILTTHADADHIGGFPAVLEQFAVTKALISSIPGDSSINKTFSERLETEGSEVVFGKRNIVVDFGDGLYLQLLSPGSILTKGDTNTGSLVGMLHYGNSKVLLTGDAPISIEKYLVSLDSSALQSDILKVGHHGSRTSSDPSFIETVQPEYSIISAGLNNKYGHPHQEVIDILQKNNSTILSTAELGTISFALTKHAGVQRVE